MPASAASDCPKDALTMCGMPFKRVISRLDRYETVFCGIGFLFRPLLFVQGPWKIICNIYYALQKSFKSGLSKEESIRFWTKRRNITIFNPLDKDLGFMNWTFRKFGQITDRTVSFGYG